MVSRKHLKSAKQNTAKVCPQDRRSTEVFSTHLSQTPSINTPLQFTTTNHRLLTCPTSSSPTMPSHSFVTLVSHSHRQNLINPTWLPYDRRTHMANKLSLPDKIKTLPCRFTSSMRPGLNPTSVLSGSSCSGKTREIRKVERSVLRTSAVNLKHVQ